MKLVRIAALGAVTALAACHGDSGAAPPPAPATPRVSTAVPVKKVPSAAEQTSGMVEAASVGKSELPVSLKFDLKQRPVLGQPLAIDIALVPQIDADAANVEMTGIDGLTVLPGAKAFTAGPVAAGEVYRHSIEVTPAAEGVVLLGLTVSRKHGEMTDSRVFSVPLIVEH